MSLPKSILHWSIGDVAHWLAENNFEAEILDFKEHQIDGKALALLQKSDIKELIKRIGPRVKFRTKLSQLLCSRGLSNSLHCNNRNQISECNKGLQHDGTGIYYNSHSYNAIPAYQQQQPYQQQKQAVLQNVRCPNGTEQISNHQYYQQSQQLQPQHQRQQLQPQQNFKSIHQYQSYQHSHTIKTGNQSQQKPLCQVTNHNSQFQLIQPSNVQQGVKNRTATATENISVKPLSLHFHNYKQTPGRDKHHAQPHISINADNSMECTNTHSSNNGSYNNINSNNNTDTTNCNNCNYNNNSKGSSNDADLDNARNICTCEVEITKFLKGSGFKQEPDVDEELANNQNSIMSVDNQIDGNTVTNEIVGNDAEENENHNETNKMQHEIPENEKENIDVTVVENISEGGSINSEYGGDDDQDEFVSMVDDITNGDEDGERYPVLDVSSIADPCDNSDKKLNKQDQKLGIEAVTNRLALRERSKIFRRSEKKWHVAVNETAFQMVLKDPELLLRKKNLRLMAESEVRKTYRFAKGKSRSIAIPENRIAAEERKKQKLTKEKILELKRQVTAEGEEVSRKMRQCHMNLTLSSQQSDEIKTKDLRDEMQKLNQQQAKLHFTMDELIKNENKLCIVPMSSNKLHSIQFQQQQQQQHQQYQQQAFVAVSEPNGVAYVGQKMPQQIAMISPSTVGRHQFVSPQGIHPQVISPQGIYPKVISPQSAHPQISIVPSQLEHASSISPISQVHVDEHGRVLQMNTDNNTPLVIYNGDNRNKSEQFNTFVNYVNI